MVQYGQADGDASAHIAQDAGEDKTMNSNDFLVRDPKICGGQTVFKGTRVPLRTVLASLAEGDSFDTLLEAFPTLAVEHLRAAVSFAATSALEDQPVSAVPDIR